MDEESATLRESYACFQISVENRDYHQLSHSEIGGAKGISRHLSGETVPAHLQNLVSGYATNQASDIQSVTTSVYQDRCGINLYFDFATKRVLSLGASLQQQSFYFILTQNLNQSFGKKERN